MIILLQLYRKVLTLKRSNNVCSPLQQPRHCHIQTVNARNFSLLGKYAENGQGAVHRTLWPGLARGQSEISSSTEENVPHECVVALKANYANKTALTKTSYKASCFFEHEIVFLNVLALAHLSCAPQGSP